MKSLVLLERIVCVGVVGDEAVWDQVFKGDRKRPQRTWKKCYPLREHGGMCSAVEKGKQEPVGFISEFVIEKFQNLSQNSKGQAISGKWREFYADCGNHSVLCQQKIPGQSGL